jgi:carboxyl-terminal processing protease
VTAPLDSERPQHGSTSGAFFVLGFSLGMLAALLGSRAVALWLRDHDLELVRAVRDFALEEFVDPVEPGSLTEDALEGMLQGLDEFSHYYDASEASDLDRETSGQFRGIGVVFRSSEVGRILFAYPGSPADEAGLRVGDRILSVGGRRVSGDDARELQALLRQDSSTLEVEVEGLDGSVRPVLLEPDVVLDPTVRHARIADPERQLGYLAIRSFSHRTPEEFDQALQGLRQRGLQGLIVDLRANPGGILDAAVQVANRFVRSGVIVSTRTRAGEHASEADPRAASCLGLPLALLIDERSASASEVLAAALQDHCAAVLVGEPSYGKGTVQTLRHLGRDRGVVKLTTAVYFSPSGRRIEHDESASGAGGIAPDLWVPLDLAEKEAVHRFLDTYSPPESALAALAAWEEREGADLITDAPADAQLAAALALLSGAELDLHADRLR